MRRTTVATLAVVIGLAGAAPVASAGDGNPSVDDLPEVDDATLDRLVSDIDIDRISSIDVDRISNIDLDGRIGKLEVETTEGSETVVRLDSDILFEFGEAKLPPAAPAQIEDLVAEVPRGAAVSIGGHTDNVGRPASNQALSEQRAQAVADVIGSVRSDLKLAVAGFGETKPIEPNESGGDDNPEGRAKNRRVEIRYES